MTDVIKICYKYYVDKLITKNKMTQNDNDDVQINCLDAQSKIADVRALTDKTYEIMFESVLDETAAGSTLTSILRRDPRRVSYNNYRSWIFRDDGRKARFKAAQEIGCDAIADHVIDIADAADADNYQQAKLQIDARRWLLSKRAPKVYGDKTTAEMTGAEGAPLVVSWLK